MPWFITAICSRKTMEVLKERHQNFTRRIPPQSRCFGFYNTYNEAYEAVDTNRGSMEECLYDYIVMEYIEPGIHSCVHSTQWWEWSTALGKWSFLTEEDTPEEFGGICNWALG